MDYPSKVKRLIESFSLLPGIGKKTAERLAIYTLTNLGDSQVDNFSNALKDIKSIKFCKVCNNICDESDICNICSNELRNDETIIVVENLKDVFILEKMQNYKGKYHILGGAINFSAGIGIDDIHIDSLLKRVKECNTKEVILATNATVEGETTAKYIKTLLKDYNCNVTRIAHGLPVGSDMSYADEMTLLASIEGRRNY